MNWLRTVAVGVGCCALFVVAGCHDNLFDGQSDLVVVNASQCEVTVTVDGWEACSVRPQASKTVDNVGSGRHVLEAKDDRGRLIERRYVDLRHGEDYYWHLEACSPH
ncbi:MAG: hypothetical protein ACHQQS_16050 [Thermoanaerobaculales bacterium]